MGTWGQPGRGPKQGGISLHQPSAPAPVLQHDGRPARLYLLHDPRLATPLRKGAWLNRVRGSPCQKVP